MRRNQIELHSRIINWIEINFDALYDAYETFKEVCEKQLKLQKLNFKTFALFIARLTWDIDIDNRDCICKFLLPSNIDTRLGIDPDYLDTEAESKLIDLEESDEENI